MRNYTHNFFILLLLGLLVCGPSARGQATDGWPSHQNYPVTASAFVVGQPNQKLSAYFSSDRSLTVTLLLKDLTKNSVQVYLRWSMEGPGVRVSGMDGYIPASMILLERGIPRRLSGLELQNDYFRQHLIREEGLRGTALRTNLPEGFYTFRVQALEAGTGREVSNLAETYFSVTTPLPPVVNLPFNGADVAVTGTRPPVIQWMPRHYRMPGHTTTYDLLVCRIPEGMEPTEAMEACVNPVIDDRANPGTLYPSNTGIGNSPIGAFEYGARYAVRVTVREFDQNGDEVLFVNQGQSEVTWFRYGGGCLPVQDFSARQTGPGRVLLSWRHPPGTADPVCRVFYRRQGESQWQTAGQAATGSLSLSGADIAGLATGSWEFTVLSACQTDPDAGATLTWEWEDEPQEEIPPILTAPLATVVTVNGCGGTGAGELAAYYPSDSTSALRKIPSCALQASSFSDCSQPHPVITPAATGVPLQALTAGDVLGMYDFAVFVTQAVADGNGGFSGRGLVPLPFLDGAMALAEFSGVKAWSEASGGCVYESAGFRIVNASQAETARALSGLLATLSGQPPEDTFAGTLAEALQAYNPNGPCAPAAAVLEVTRQLTEVLDGAEAAGQILGALNAVAAALENGEAIDSLETRYRAILADLDVLVSQAVQEQQARYGLYNTEVSALTQQSARLSWEADGDFDRYVIHYTGPEGATLQQTVTSPFTELQRLGMNTTYHYRITAYKGNQALAGYEGTFTTLPRQVPVPENLAYTASGERSVRITWDPNPLHHSYRLVYLDENGIQRTAYPTTNAVTLEGITPDRIYDYELVALDDLRQESDPANGRFNAGWVCQVSVHGFREVLAGGELVLEARNCNPYSGSYVYNGQEPPATYVMWETPEGMVQGNTIRTFPREDFTYRAICYQESAQRLESCSAEFPVRVVPQCEGVAATVTPPVISYGDRIILQAEGCTGNVKWTTSDDPMSVVGAEANIIATPEKEIPYYLHCELPDGEKCIVQTETVEMDCGLELAVQQNSPYVKYRWPDPIAQESFINGLFHVFNVVPFVAVRNLIRVILNGSVKEEAYIQATGCPGTVVWNYDQKKAQKNEEKSPGNTLYLEKIKKEITVTAQCNTGTDRCSQSIEVSPQKKACRDFQISVENDTTSVYYMLLKINSESNVIWNDGSTDRERRIPVPYETTVFSVENAEGCRESVVIELPAPGNPIVKCGDFILQKISGSSEIPASASSASMTFKATGCMVEKEEYPVQWMLTNVSDNTEQALAGTGQTQVITFTENNVGKTFRVSATCTLTGQTEVRTVKVTRKNAPPPQQLLKNPCDFVLYTDFEALNNTFLQGETVEIKMFGEIGQISVFYENDRNRIVREMVNGIENKGGYSIIKLRTGNGINANGNSTFYGSFDVKVINTIPVSGSCTSIITINVAPNRSTGPYNNPTPVNIDFSVERERESCSLYALGGSTIPVIRQSEGSTVRILRESNNLLNFGVISLYDDYIGRVYNGIIPPERTGLVDKVCNAHQGANSEWFRGRNSNGLQNPMPGQMKYGYYYGLETSPDFNQSVVYYTRCTFRDGTYCISEVKVDPNLKTNARTGEIQTPQDVSATQQEDCLFPKKVIVQSLLTDLLCRQLPLIEGLEAQKLHAVQDALATRAIELGEITDEMVSMLQDGRCREVVERLTVAVEGNVQIPAATGYESYALAEGLEPLFNEVIDQLLADSLTLTAYALDAVCEGGNGHVSLQAGGGKTPYRFSLDGLKYQESPEFTDVKPGSYTFTVMDSTGSKAVAAVSIGITPLYEEVEQTFYQPSLPNARAEGDSSFTVQWDALSTPYTFTPKAGVTIERRGNRIHVTTTAPEDKQWDGEYGIYFAARDHNRLAGFYREGYGGEPCTPSGFAMHCGPLCREGFLPQEVYDDRVIFFHTLSTGTINLNNFENQYSRISESDIENHTNLLGKSNISILRHLPENSVRNLFEYAPNVGFRYVVSSPNDQDIISKFYSKTGGKMIFRENSPLSMDLLANPTFTDYYASYIERIKKKLEIGAVDELDEEFLFSTNSGGIDKPNFSKILEIPQYDYYGIIGGVQRLEVVIRIVKLSNGSFQIDSEFRIEDTFGADWDDIGSPSDNSLKANMASLNAFFWLQHWFEYPPFTTRIIHKRTSTITIK